MPTYYYTVSVTSKDKDDADRIMAERLSHDEEYEGVGDYTVDWAENEIDNPEE